MSPTESLEGREAVLWEALDGGRVRCELCEHHCVIPSGGRGRCGVRENREGRLFALTWELACAAHVDPIEKKPLFHYLPGSLAYSVASVGCNFRCSWCQNHGISQVPRDGGPVTGKHLPAAEIVELALAADCASIAYTYTEPTIFFEYALATARIARTRGLGNVFVTNGYMSEGALEMLLPHLDGANVDLKAFREETYREKIGGHLDPVLRNIGRMVEAGVLVEVTTLLVPDLNDSAEELGEIASFLADLSPDIPWHVSRFHPDYQMNDRGLTSHDAMSRALKAGQDAGLRHVYAGNLPGHDSESTFCWRCGKRVIERWGFSIRSSCLGKDGACPDCGATIAIRRQANRELRS